jgi:GWxTD domain-containing protein
MFTKKSINQTALVAVFIVFSAIYASSQSKNDKPQATDPSDRPKKVLSEPRDAHKKWIRNDVPYILTPAEEKAFLALKTDDERENFIAIFWRNRDPNPETVENEYRDEYYERIAYANEHFASGIPGWKTDRGRIYITWGKPDSIESRPSGGTYDRPSYEGGGSTTTYPFETWFYRHLDGVGDGIEIEFVDRTGSGEYRIARDADEKDALAMVSGARARNNLGEANSHMREQDTPMARMSRISALETPPRVKFSDLDPLARSDTGTIDDDPLKFDVRLDYFRQSDDKVIVAVTVQTDNKQVQFDRIGGLEQATMNIFGRITAVSGKKSGIFEDSVTTSATTLELADLKDKKSVYQKAIALSPGNYKVDVVVRDVGTGNKGLVNMGFVVPRYDEKKLSTSSLVLASKLRPTSDRDTGTMFVVGNSKVIPNLSGSYRLGQEVGIYLQVYNAEIDQTTLRPSVDVDYVLFKDGKEILRQREDWTGLSDSGRRLTLARLLPTTTMPRGEYEIKVQIKDRVGGQVIENKGKFTITQ